MAVYESRYQQKMNQQQEANMIKMVRFGLAVAAVLCLLACGGGGDGDAGPASAEVSGVTPPETGPSMIGTYQLSEVRIKLASGITLTKGDFAGGIKGEMRIGPSMMTQTVTLGSQVFSTEGGYQILFTSPPTKGSIMFNDWARIEEFAFEISGLDVMIYYGERYGAAWGGNYEQWDTWTKVSDMTSVPLEKSVAESVSSFPIVIGDFVKPAFE